MYFGLFKFFFWRIVLVSDNVEWVWVEWDVVEWMEDITDMAQEEIMFWMQFMLPGRHVWDLNSCSQQPGCAHSVIFQFFKIERLDHARGGKPGTVSLVHSSMSSLITPEPRKHLTWWSFERSTVELLFYKINCNNSFKLNSSLFSDQIHQTSEVVKI